MSSDDDIDSRREKYGERRRPGKRPPNPQADEGQKPPDEPPPGVAEPASVVEGVRTPEDEPAGVDEIRLPRDPRPPKTQWKMPSWRLRPSLIVFALACAVLVSFLATLGGGAKPGPHHPKLPKKHPHPALPSGPTHVWAHTVVVAEDQSFGLDTSDVPTGPDAPFEVYTGQGNYEYIFTTVSFIDTGSSTSGQVAPWTGAGEPTLSGCDSAFGSNKQGYVPLDNLPRGSWLCARTPSGRLARLRYEGETGPFTAASFKFFVTVDIPAR